MGGPSCVLFSSHPRAKNWHPTFNGDLKPSDVALHSNKKFWFKCDKCTHSFNTALECISKGSWCPYCSNHKIWVKNRYVPKVLVTLNEKL